MGEEEFLPFSFTNKKYFFSENNPLGFILATFSHQTVYMRAFGGLLTSQIVWKLSACSFFQLNYADMLKRVEPLRNELQKLEDDAKDNQQKANEVEQMIRDLETSIARYKEEYAVLISEAQAIKADLAAVEAKVRLPLFIKCLLIFC